MKPARSQDPPHRVPGSGVRPLLPVLLLPLAILSAATGALAQAPPGEVGSLLMDFGSTLAWDPAAGADHYDVYRGSLSREGILSGAACHGLEIQATSFPSPAEPAPGQGFFYLVTAGNLQGHGTAGAGTTSTRALRGSCETVIRSHVMNRLGYGMDEWSRDRYGLLGRQGYIEEQLAPETIDEGGNALLKNRDFHFIPPESNFELVGLEIVEAAYARRQLEHQATLFWTNHFNTDYRKSFDFFGFYPYTERAYESVKVHYDARMAFRDLAFNGTFRQILEASALSPAMLLFLDGATNVAGAPNENHARELLELHSMGVNQGYTQQDIVELARVLTGWNVCKKRSRDAGDPLAPCVAQQGETQGPAGEWVRNFRPQLHDGGQKVLFAGTSWETVIPDTSASPEAGVLDIQLALDAIAAHPSTPRFIATKLLKWFVAEDPGAPLVDPVVAAWNDPSNPRGDGDLREVLRAVVSLPGFLDPDRIGGKIRTPFEHVAAALRASRGKTDGLTAVPSYLIRMSHHLHENPVPTGYPELGGDWLDTNNLLERQNFALDLTSRTAFAFGADVIALLEDHGVATDPAGGDPAAIVTYFSQMLFGGALSPGELALAESYLTTDATGAPSPWDDTRIRETLGFMMGFAQFLEQ